MIVLNNIFYKYPRGDREIIRGVSACFDKGEIVAVTGPNGCGKTTLTKLIVGIYRPDAGSIAIDGADTSGLDLADIGRRAGYVFQNPDRQLFCDTVYNEVAYGLKNMGCGHEEPAARVRRYLDMFGLTPLRESYPGRLSRGEKQRVALAAILAMGTDYIILDEPTTGLDVRTRNQLGRLLAHIKQEQDCGIIIVSHERSFIEAYADREWVIA